MVQRVSLCFKEQEEFAQEIQQILDEAGFEAVEGFQKESHVVIWDVRIKSPPPGQKPLFIFLPRGFS